MCHTSTGSQHILALLMCTYSGCPKTCMKLTTFYSKVDFKKITGLCTLSVNSIQIFASLVLHSKCVLSVGKSLAQTSDFPKIIFAIKCS